MAKSTAYRAIGPTRFDPQAHELRNRAGQTVSLRPQTSAVLSTLLDRIGEVVTKQDLIATVWRDTHVTDDSLVQCISEIRKALGPEEAGLLDTIPKCGYRLQSAEAVARPATIRRPGLALTLVFVMVLAVLPIVGFVVYGAALGQPTRTIAVLPFVNLGGDDRDDYFSDGLTEDLLTDLSRIGSLTVISRTSSFAFRGQPKTLQDIAAELGVDYVVEGSVRRLGDRVRVSVALVDAGTDAAVWSQRFDRRFGEIFALQDDMRYEIMAALAIRVGRPDAGRRTEDVAAYDLFLRARYRESEFTREGVTQAITLYGQAIRIDPAYGEAYARMANMYDFNVRFGWSLDAAGDRDKAMECALRAIELDPADPFAHWVYGRVLSRLGSLDAESHERAIAALRRAIELDHNYADAYAFLSLLLVGDGQVDGAVAAMETAIRLNPKFPFWYAQNRAIIAYMRSDYAAAIADFEQAAARNPTAVFTHWWLAAAYAMADRPEDAEWEVEEARALGVDPTVDQIVQSNPVFRYPEYERRFAEGLGKAGFPQG